MKEEDIRQELNGVLRIGPQHPLAWRKRQTNWGDTFTVCFVPLWWRTDSWRL